VFHAYISNISAILWREQIV